MSGVLLSRAQGTRPDALGITSSTGYIGGYTNFTGLNIEVPTQIATATPGVVINSSGVGNPLEVRKAKTPVFYVDVDGNVTYTGVTSAGGLVGAAVGVRAPTAVGTATPAFFVDSTGGLSIPFEVRYSNTPVVVVSSAGGVAAVGGVSGTTLIGSSYVQALRKVTAKTGVTVALSAAEVSMGLVSDLGDTGAITLTLPTAVAGYDVILFNKRATTGSWMWPMARIRFSI